MSRKCLIILNGPSVINVKTFLAEHPTENFDIIAVNRWLEIFKRLGLRSPDYVVVGKNSLSYNRPLIKQLPGTIFYGIDKYSAKNYVQLTFGPTLIYGKRIDMKGALWWSGLYAIQLALKLQYDEIHVFGFTCTDQPDYGDLMRREPIRHGNLVKIVQFLTDLKENEITGNKLFFYENMITHPFRQLIT